MDEEGEEIEGVPAFFHRHPLLFCFLLFLAFTYAFVYPVFAFILASAPVLVLTAFLLGLVLLNSVPQDHDPHVYKKISHRPPQYQPTATAVVGPRPTDESPPTSDSSSSSSADDDNYNRPTMSTATSHASFPDTAANSESESTDSDHKEKQQNHQQRSEKKEAVRAVAWTADDDKSIENISSLELEMNATVEKLMSRRRARGHQRPLHHHHHHVMDLVDIDDPSKLSITTRKSNPFNLDGPYDEDDNFPDSAPSMLGLRPSRNPFFDDMDDNLHLQAPPQPSPIPGAGAGAAAAQKNAMLFRRHESFTVGAPYVSDFRPSRFRPYFVTEKMQGQPVTIPEASRKSSSSSTSSSSAGATAYACAYTSANKEEEAAAEQEALAEAEAEAAAVLEEVKTEEYSSRSREVVAVDVELISDSSDDDMTLPGGHAGKQHQVQVQQQQQQQQQVAEQEQQMKMEQQQQQQQAAEQEQRMKLQQLAEHEQRLKQQQQQLAEQEQRLKLQQQVAEQEQQMKMQQQQQHQLALSDEDDEGDSFEVESITKQVAAAAAGKTKQLEADPAYDYSPSVSAGKTEKKQQEAAFAPLPPVAPNKLQSMRRVFSEEDADEPWAAPSALEETGNEAFPLPPLPESAPSAGAAPPLSAAAKKAVGKSTKYKPPTKKAVLGFFRK